MRVKRKDPVKINRSVIKDLPPSPPSGTKDIIWDIQVPGFGVYRTWKERVSFLYQYRPTRGKTRSRKIGSYGEFTPESARDVAADWARQRRQGINPIDALRAKAANDAAENDLVLDKYAEAWIERREKSGKPMNRAQTNALRNDVVRVLGKKRIDKLTVDDIEAFDHDLRPRGEGAVRVGMVILKTMLNDAVRRGKIPYSPAAAVRTPKSGVRTRKLRDHEIKRYLEAAHDLGGPRGDLAEVILRTLKRKEECGGMRWEAIDLSSGIWSLAASETKGRKPHDVKLPRQVLAIIERQQPDHALRRGPIFTLDGGRTAPVMGSQVKDLLDANMHRRVELANERDGTAHSIDHWTIHDLRRTGASKMQDPLGVTKDVINAVLLHVVGGGVDQVYLQAELVEPAGKALQAYNDLIDDMMQEPDVWPGARDLPTLTIAEIKARCSLLRKGWPERTDQTKARLKREDQGGQPEPRKRRAGTADPTNASA